MFSCGCGTHGGAGGGAGGVGGGRKQLADRPTPARCNQPEVDWLSNNLETIAMKRSDVIRMLRRRQGSRSLRTFAAELGCSPSYLSDLYRSRRDPGPMVLQWLGLKREATVEYRSKEDEYATFDQRELECGCTVDADDPCCYGDNQDEL